MANFNKTNPQHVKQQNAKSASQAANQAQFGTEFGSETVAGTNIQAVKKRNQQAEAKKNQNS